VKNAAITLAKGFIEAIKHHPYFLLGRLVVERVTDGIKSAAGFVSSAASWVKNRFVEFVHNGVASFLSLGSWIVNRVGEGVRGTVEALRSGANWIRNRIVEFVHDGVSGLLNLGEWIVGRIKAGITSAPVSIFKDAAEWLKDKIVGAVKSALGIKSPSRVMMSLGHDIAAGLWKGIVQIKDIPDFIKHNLGGMAKLGGQLIKAGVIDLPLKLLMKGGDLAGEVFDVLGGGGGIPGLNNIVAIGRMLQKAGFSVGEHPAFGGVGKHAPGSYHYKGRAIDVNADNAPGGEMRALDALYKFLKKLPHAELLWRVEDHFDHLHFAMAQGGISPGGFARVGELGPEDVWLPRGARVMQASQSHGGGDLHLTVNNYGERINEVAFARELAFQIETR
jgi:hypothetical protein